VTAVQPACDEQSSQHASNEPAGRMAMLCWWLLSAREHGTRRRGARASEPTGGAGADGRRSGRACWKIEQAVPGPTLRPRPGPTLRPTPGPSGATANARARQSPHVCHTVQLIPSTGSRQHWPWPSPVLPAMAVAGGLYGATDGSPLALHGHREARGQAAGEREIMSRVWEVWERGYEPRVARGWVWDGFGVWGQVAINTTFFGEGKRERERNGTRHAPGTRRVRALAMLKLREEPIDRVAWGLREGGVGGARVSASKERHTPQTSWGQRRGSGIYMALTWGGAIQRRVA